MAVVPAIVGQFGKVFGIQGWIKVISFTDPQENILELKPWLIKKNGEWEELELESIKKHSGSIVVKIPGYDTPERARSFTNIEIGVDRNKMPKLPDGEFYWTELVGLEVINKEGINLGQVKDLIATGANDVLVVKGEKKRLIPYISSVIIEINRDTKVIHVDWDESF